MIYENKYICWDLLCFIYTLSVIKRLRMSVHCVISMTRTSLVYFTLSLYTVGQVEVEINTVPSKCTGDCSFSWSDVYTPVITAISPETGIYRPLMWLP